MSPLTEKLLRSICILPVVSPLSAHIHSCPVPSGTHHLTKMSMYKQLLALKTIKGIDCSHTFL